MKSENKKEVEEKMQAVLGELGINLKVMWVPNPTHNKHGEIEQSSRTLFLYDSNPEEAWQTLLHEALEWKLKQVTQIYRTIINGLIDTLEKIAYKNKEEFLEFIPKILEEVRKAEQG